MTEHPAVRASAESVRSHLRTTTVDWLRFAVVSIYLALVGVALVLSRRIALGLSLRHLAAVLVRRMRRRAGPVADVVTEQGQEEPGPGNGAR